MGDAVALKGVFRPIRARSIASDSRVIASMCDFERGINQEGNDLAGIMRHVSYLYSVQSGRLAARLQHHAFMLH
jgi:hypothetical protein